MSYIALYRKLRPRKFENIIGQSHIVRTLKNQIQKNRVSHAYIFSGTRGTGKTSMAKILAQGINCENNNDGEPCLECNMCKNILAQRSMNVIEIDAASNNGVDNIRDIREEVKYPPTEGSYKVYIIDEVHMLSIGAFNALLKTLEEPPSHVVFILATTDIQKIPPTILSRCQRFDFKRISNKDMVNELKKYMDHEKISITEESLKYIARLSDGAMRDALSILDQCIAFYFDEEISIDKVQEIIGSVDNKVFYTLTSALINYNSNKCLDIIKNIISSGRDIPQFTNEFLTHLRNLLVSKSIKTILDADEISIENFDELKKISTEIPQDILFYYIREFSQLTNGLKFDQNPRVSLEVTCIKLCNPEDNKQNITIASRLDKLEKTIQSGKINFSNEKKNNIIEEKIIVVKEKAIPKDIKNVINSFKDFLQTLDVSKSSLLTNSFPAYLDGNTLYFIGRTEFDEKYLNNNYDFLKKNLEDYYKKEFFIIVISEVDYDNKHMQIYGGVDSNKQNINFANLEKSINFKIDYGNNY